jgi:hypothetical protein
MTTPASLPERRPIYDDDLNVRLEAAMARTRLLLKCSRAIRATIGAKYGLPFTPRCGQCQELGRTHVSPLTSEQYYICARCQNRWAVQPTAS